MPTRKSGKGPHKVKRYTEWQRLVGQCHGDMKKASIIYRGLPHGFPAVPDMWKPNMVKTNTWKDGDIEAYKQYSKLLKMTTDCPTQEDCKTAMKRRCGQLYNGKNRCIALEFGRNPKCIVWKNCAKEAGVQV